MTKSKLLKTILFLISIVFFSQYSLGQGVGVDSGASGGVSNGLLIGTHFFYYADNSTLGDDELKDGSSVFTRFDLHYNFADFFVGGGLFYESDSFGEDQKNTITGLVIEFFAGSIFIKIMPGSIEQSFQNRSFTKRTGSFLGIEPGIRGDLYGGTLFYEVVLHTRTQTINQEDGRSMSDEFKKTETMPMLGLGISL